MALVLTETKVYSRYNSRNFYKFVWDNLDQADTAPVDVHIPSSVKFKMKVVGNFGAGGNVKLQGSIDAITWDYLNDSDGSLIMFAAAGEKEVLKDHVFCYLRPIVSAGTGVDVDVTILAIP